MNIAVSTVVLPSRWLSNLVLGICLMAVVVSVLVGSGWIAGISGLSRMMITVACLFAIFIACVRAFGDRKTCRIDISGVGQIRLTILRKYPQPDRQSPYGHGDYSEGDIVRLMSDSTFWPCLLLLRLKDERRNINTLFILPDSVSRESFRRLSVACRWIAVHSRVAEVRIL